MVVLVRTGTLKARVGHRISHRFGHVLDRLEAAFFGQDGGPDRLVGWLVRANAADQALISLVYKGRLDFGPDGARSDYRPPEREAWRRERRWRLETAWGLIVVMQDRPAMVLMDLVLIGIALIALANNIVHVLMRWFA